MEHVYRAGDPSKPTLILLHGTGGDEHSLLEIASFLDPQMPVVSLRGTVSENGALRFFRRFAEGNFDWESIEKNTDELLDTLRSLAEHYAFSLENTIIVGYSNGANIGAHLLLSRDKAPIKRGIFFHPMFLGKDAASFSLADKEVWLSNGENDPLLPAGNFEQLTTAFEKRRAAVVPFYTSQGHQLLSSELKAAKEWLNK